MPYNARTEYAGNGVTTSWQIGFPFISPNHIKVTVNGVPKTIGSQFNVVGGTNVVFTVGNTPPVGHAVVIKRQTPTNPPASFTATSYPSNDDLNALALYSRYRDEEIADELYDFRQQLALEQVTNTGETTMPGMLSPVTFGAIRDGTLHTAAEWVATGKYANLLAVQAVYPFCTSLDESIDYLALQKCVQLAAFTGDVVLYPRGLVINRSIQFDGPVLNKGSGLGDWWLGFNPFRKAKPHVTVVGDGAVCRSVKTRIKYRGSSSDPADDPTSAAFDVQAAGVSFDGIDLHCQGTNWDYGIFNGCRLNVRAFRCSITAGNRNDASKLWRIAAFYVDATSAPSLTPLTNWRGESYSAPQVSGADGWGIAYSVTWGGAWGVIVRGPDPKPGLTSRGKEYTADVGITFNRIPLNGEEIALTGTPSATDATVVFVDPDAGGSYPGKLIVRIQTTLADTIAATAAVLNDAVLDTENEEDFNTGIGLARFEYDGVDSVLHCYRRVTSRPIPTSTDKYWLYFRVSTAATTTFTLQNGGVPTAITTDPALIWDPVLGLIPDERGQFGGSDGFVAQCNIGGCNLSSLIPLYGNRRSDNRWDLEGLSTGCIWIEGGISTTHKWKIVDTRLQCGGNVFALRLGRVAQGKGIIDNVIPDGSGTIPSGSPAGTKPLDVRYCPFTRILGKTQGIAVRNAVVSYEGLDTQWNPGAVPGDTWISDNRGDIRGFVGRFSRMVISQANRFKGYALMELIGGTDGVANITWRTAATLYGQLRMNLETGEFNIRSYVGQLLIQAATVADYRAVDNHLFRIGNASRFQIFDTKVSSYVPIDLPSYNTAGLPSASTLGASSMAFCTDAPGGATIVVSNGTIWKKVTLTDL